MEPVIRTLWRDKERCYIIDQRKLPGKEEYVVIENAEDAWQAIRTLQVRGAPAIGCAAAYGVAIGALHSQGSRESLAKRIKNDINYLKTARPTAYNLFFALQRMEDIVDKSSGCSMEDLKGRLIAEADDIYNEDLSCCYAIGLNGCRLIANGMNILTHCNAGALATSGYGTALAPFYAAIKKNMRFHVFVDETRPVLQGARLTAWELSKARIPYTLICDNVAGYLMQQSRIDMVITGADRIALNGDTANKIGTYPLAVLAYYHGIDFYVAAPRSTFDPLLNSGRDIPVEERDGNEVKKMNDYFLSPETARVYNPAFDITPVELIKAFITENGIITADKFS